MSSDNGDFFGGAFDFDGNGKTTTDEEVLAYSLLNDAMKESGAGFTTHHKKTKKAEPAKQDLTPDQELLVKIILCISGIVILIGIVVLIFTKIYYANLS